MYVAELSRTGRRTEQVLALLRSLNERGVKVVCLRSALTFDGSPMSTLLVTLLIAVYAMELETLRERTRLGIAASRARSRMGGRPVALTEAQRCEVRRMRGVGRPAKKVAEVFGVSERTSRRVTEKGVGAEGQATDWRAE